MCQRAYPQPSESATRAASLAEKNPPEGEFGIWHIKVVPIIRAEEKSWWDTIATQAQRQFNPPNTASGPSSRAASRRAKRRLLEMGGKQDAWDVSGQGRSSLVPAISAGRCLSQLQGASIFAGWKWLDKGKIRCGRLCLVGEAVGQKNWLLLHT